MLSPTTCVGLRYGPLGSLFLAGPTRDCRFGRGPRVLSPGCPGFNALFRQCAPASPPRRFHCRAGTGMLTGSPSESPRRVILRPRLTLIRLALIRKPRSFGVGVSRPHCRYSCLHLLFQKLQHTSPCAFAAAGMLPYHPRISSGIPRFGTALDARLSSAPCRSTSELLRTLQRNSCFQANLLAVSAAGPPLPNLARISGP